LRSPIRSDIALADPIRSSWLEMPPFFGLDLSQPVFADADGDATAILTSVFCFRKLIISPLFTFS
jgi:hypothetical protein